MFFIFQSVQLLTMLCNTAQHFPADVYSCYIFFMILSISISGLVAGNFYMRHSAHKTSHCVTKSFFHSTIRSCLSHSPRIYAIISLPLYNFILRGSLGL